MAELREPWSTADGDAARLVIVESPYAGDVDSNVWYARAALADSLRRGEAPYASHLLYTQLGVLRDEDPLERQLGIAAGFAWRPAAELTAFYVDRGWSSGMRLALEDCRARRLPFEERRIVDELDQAEPVRRPAMTALEQLVAGYEQRIREADSTLCEAKPWSWSSTITHALRILRGGQ